MVKFAKSLLLISVSGYGWCCATLTVKAQIVPDRSLGSESSRINPDVSLPGKEVIDHYLEGGAVRGKNLFHSFSEFNLSEQDNAYFASPPEIEHIFTRITGSNPSHLDGTLGVNGSADLFFLNPHGVIFGANSQLDLTGSLLITSGDRFLFDNDFSFSASNPEVPPLLTVNFPVGVQFGAAPGTIINRAGSITPQAILESSADESPVSRSEGLRINQGQNLSFLGGEIAVEGGYFHTEGGKIELGAIGANGKVGLNADGQYWQLDYAEVDTFADLQFEQHGGIDGGQIGQTQIELWGKNISLGYDIAELKEYRLEDFFSLAELSALDELPGDRIVISAQNQDDSITPQINIQASDTFSIIDPGKTQQNLLVNTAGRGDGGEINLTAKQIVLYGASLESWTLANAEGNAGKINFTAEDVTIQHGGAGTNTYGRGNGGRIDLDISRDLKIQFGGFGSIVHDPAELDPAPIPFADEAMPEANIVTDTSITDSSRVRNGGTIAVQTHNLEIRSAGMGVTAIAPGNGGQIELDIGEELKVTAGGFGADASSEGSGGSIDINARHVKFIDAGVGANTRRGTAKGGNISLNAETISLKNGIIGAESGQDVFDERNADEQPQLELFQRDAGDGGNIFIQADKLLIDGGNITTSTFGKGNAGDIRLRVDFLEAIGAVDEKLVTGINSSTDGDGNGGKISVTGDRIKLVNGATIAANSSASGRAGNIELNLSNQLLLKDQGTISVDGGANGLPGEIIIYSQDLLLDGEGKISATTNQGTRGNIRLKGKSLRLENNSQIVTNAGQDAMGGNIFIDLQHNLLGLDNSRITASAEQGQGGNITISTKGLFFEPESQISASSRFGIDGLIHLDTPEVNPNADLIQFPTQPIDPNLHLSRVCSSTQNNQFASVGKGGLPENPLTNIFQEDSVADLEPLLTRGKRDATGLESNSRESKLPRAKPIVEAQTWRVARHGKIELVALRNRTMPNPNLDCLK